MLKLREGIVELYKKVASAIPSDVEEALKKAFEAETAPNIRESLGKILRQIPSSRKASRPLCLDTGIPFFFVWVPRGLSQQHVREVIVDATRIATKKVPLSPNAVDALTGVNSGDNTGLYFPLIHIEETDKNSLTIDLMLQGSECENLGKIYKLPTSFIAKEIEMMVSKFITIFPDFEKLYCKEILKLSYHTQYCFALIDWTQGRNYLVRERLRPFLSNNLRAIIPFLLSFLPYVLYKTFLALFYKHVRKIPLP